MSNNKSSCVFSWELGCRLPKNQRVKSAKRVKTTNNSIAVTSFPPSSLAPYSSCNPIPRSYSLLGSWLFFIYTYICVYTHIIMHVYNSFGIYLVLLVCICVSSWPLGLDNLSGHSSLEKDWLLFPQQSSNAVALHLGVRPCEISPASVGMSYDIVIFSALIWVNMSLPCHECRFPVV